jgi:hypothetical protein
VRLTNVTRQQLTRRAGKGTGQTNPMGKPPLDISTRAI